MGFIQIKRVHPMENEYSFLRPFSEAGQRFVFNGKSLAMVQVDDDISDFLNKVKIHGIDQARVIFGESRGKECLETVLRQIKEMMRLDSTLQMPHHPSIGTNSSVDIHEVYLSLTTECNLSCRYCYAERIETSAPRFMTKETAQQSVEFLISRSSASHPLTIVLWGGEPLLNMNVLEFVLRFTSGQMQRLKRSVLFATTTNGTLLTPEASSLLARYRVAVNVSLDGDEQCHDAYRVFRSGMGSFSSISRHLPSYLANTQSYFPEFVPRARMTVTHRTSQHLFENYRAIWDLGIPIVWCKEVDWVAGDPEYVLNEEDFSALDDQFSSLRKFILEEFDSPRARRYYPQIWWDLHGIHQRRAKRYTCGSGFRSVSINTDGSLSSCYHLFDRLEFRCGHVSDDFIPITCYQPEDRLVDNMPACNHCDIKYLCSGGCVAKAIAHSGCPTIPSTAECRMSRVYQDHCLRLYASLMVSPQASTIRQLLSISPMHFAGVAHA